jgi:hypothetical protein
MTTAQTIISQGQQTQRAVNFWPWVIGAVVVIVALVLITRD